MRNIWIVSDTHLYHDNCLKFTRNDGTLMRPGFDNVQQMNEFILEKHNSVVKPGDLVYHLGDVVMGRPDGFVPFFNKFHGSKRLIVGNHDDIKWIAPLGIFQKITMWRKMPDFGLIMSHVPMHASSLSAKKPGDPLMLNVHGHIHHNRSPEGPYVNLCVEQINYTPVHIDAIHALHKEQQKDYEPVLMEDFQPHDEFEMVSIRPKYDGMPPYFTDFDPDKKYSKLIYKPAQSMVSTDLEDLIEAAQNRIKDKRI